MPRPATGFQVKKPGMRRNDILTEMRPGGEIRPAIRELAERGGAYVIVSAKGSTTDSALKARRNAMREALADVTEAENLLTDFYDQTRLATWVREFPGLVAWVRARIGRSIPGWQSYGAWSNPQEGPEETYLLDATARLVCGGDRQERPVAEGLAWMRGQLAEGAERFAWSVSPASARRGWSRHCSTLG